MLLGMTTRFDNILESIYIAELASEEHYAIYG